MAKKPKGHKASCRCPFCKRARKPKRAAKRPAKRPAKRTAAKRPAKRTAAKRPSVKRAAHPAKHAAGSMEARFVTGFREGAHDVKTRKPLRKASAKTDPYAKGYRAGAAIARKERAHSK